MLEIKKRCFTTLVMSRISHQSVTTMVDQNDLFCIRGIDQIKCLFTFMHFAHTFIQILYSQNSRLAFLFLQSQCFASWAKRKLGLLMLFLASVTVSALCVFMCLMWLRVYFRWKIKKWKRLWVKSLRSGQGEMLHVRFVLCCSVLKFLN